MSRVILWTVLWSELPISMKLIEHWLRSSTCESEATLSITACRPPVSGRWGRPLPIKKRQRIKYKFARSVKFNPLKALPRNSAYTQSSRDTKMAYNVDCDHYRKHFAYLLQNHKVVRKTIGSRQQNRGSRQQNQDEPCKKYLHIQISQQELPNQYCIITRNNVKPETTLNINRREDDQKCKGI